MGARWITAPFPDFEAWEGARGIHLPLRRTVEETRVTTTQPGEGGVQRRMA